MKANKILRNSILTGIFILPFIALIVADGHFFPNLFFPFITAKNFTFRIIVEIIACLWLILALRDTTALPKSSRLLLCFVVFLATIFISDFLSPNSFKSFWSNYERMEGWVTLAHLFALFVVLSGIMTKKLWGWLFRASLFASIILFFYGCFQLAGIFQIHQGSTRIDTTIGNSAYLGGYMLFHVFFALYLLTDFIRHHHGKRERSLFWPIVYGLTALADIFILFKTATRGAEVGLAAGLFCLAAGLAFFERENKTLRKAGAGILIALVLCGGLFVALRKSSLVTESEALSRLALFTDELLTFDKSAICQGEMKSRCLLWPVALRGVAERPIFGWGQESFNYVFNKYYNPEMYGQEQWFDRTHNVIFDWLVAGGILGLLAYLSLFGFSLYYLWRKGGPFSVLEKSVFTGLFVGYFIHNLTVFDNITSYILFIFVVAFIESSTGKTSEKLAKKIHAIDNGVKNRMIIPLISIAAVFVLYVVNVPSILAASELIYALSSLPGSPAANLTHYEKAFSYKGFGDSEIREQLAQTTSQAAGVASVDQDVKNAFFKLTKEQMIIQLSLTPEDARYYFFAGSFLASFGDYDDGIAYVKKALELSPKKQKIMMSLGSIYLNKGDFKEAVATLKQAYDLAPAFEEARKLYAIALVYAKNSALADEILKPLPPENIWGDKNLLSAYYSAGYMDKAVTGVKFLIKNNPNNPQYYITLAAIYAKTGRLQEGIAMVNKAVEVNPSLKDQAAAFIEQLKSGEGF